jgi:hypothetical protein
MYTRVGREIAETDWQEYECDFDFPPHQEDLELELIRQVEGLDRQMLTATGLDVDLLQFKKNALAELIDAIAFGFSAN